MTNKTKETMFKPMKKTMDSIWR